MLLIHFNEMKNDHEGSVRKIAAHLGFEPTAEQWPKILEYTSFKWMKQNQRKFEIARCCRQAARRGRDECVGAAGTARRKRRRRRHQAWSEMMVVHDRADSGKDLWVTALPPSRPILIIAAVAALGAILVRRMLK